MKTAHRFSFSYSPEKLIHSLGQVVEEWSRHFNTEYYEGNWSGIPLREPASKNHALSARGDESESYVNTPLLERLPLIREILDSFECEKTSVRFLRLTPGSVIKPHKDPDSSFFDGDVRLHIPVITNDQVEFIVDDEQLVMLPGECWYADFSRKHSVANRGSSDRVHLVVDLKVNDWLRSLFVDEGIMTEGEERPDPIDYFDKEQQYQMVKMLLEQDNPTSKQLAQELIEKYNIDIEQE